MAAMPPPRHLRCPSVVRSFAEETAAQVGDALYHAPVSEGGPSRDPFPHRPRHFQRHLQRDPHDATRLVWSPSHHLDGYQLPCRDWREGYLIEIQALWIRLLEQLHQLDSCQSGSSSSKGSESAIDTRCPDGSWGQWAKKARDHVERLFWIEEKQWPADLLIAPSGTPAGEALRDQALRSNALWAVTLGCLKGERAQATVRAAQRHLVVPGALRSLAPLPTIPPLPIHGHHGGLLNDPSNPIGDATRAMKISVAVTTTEPPGCGPSILLRSHGHGLAVDPAAHTAALDYLSSCRPTGRKAARGNSRKSSMATPRTPAWL